MVISDDMRDVVLSASNGIEHDRQLDECVAVADALMQVQNPNSEVMQMVEILIESITKYENDMYPYEN